MENEVWNEIAMFLNDLRCGNVNRESYVLLSEMKEAEAETKAAKAKLDLGGLKPEQKEAIDAYIEAVKNQAFVAEQQAYAQGYVDCIQLLAGLGLLTKVPHIDRFIERIKK
jgi:hypothetical protein